MTSRPRDESPAGPRSVGPYTLLAKIGEGGMGVVHLARRGDGPRVALKVLRPHIVGDDEARQRLAREVSSLGRIRSRWVAEIVDADPWAPIPYVATRYVPGLSLHDEIGQEGPIEGADLLWFAGCLAEGLASVHAVGVLHRDVKPSNVLMEGRTPILIDFGLARVADDPRLTHTGWLLGTPGYLAPEILYGDDASAASDLHSWAATVAFAGIGGAPFGRGPSMAIMDRVRRGEHDLTGLTGPLREVVEAALDPEPSRRPSLDAVLAWLRPQTTRPTPLLAPPPTRGLDAGPGGGPGAGPDDPFAMSLALAAQAHDAPAAPAEPAMTAPVMLRPGPGAEDGADDGAQDDVVPEESAPTVREHPTLVLPHGDDPTLRERHPVPAPVPTPVPAVPAPAVPAAYVPLSYDLPPPYLAPTPLERPALGERLRRLGLVGAGSLAVGAAVAVAPWLTLAVVVVAVWLLRSGSLATGAVGARRDVRGRRWYDAPQLLLSTPWHLVQSVPGAVMLLVWACGLAVAAALVCYAVGAAIPVTLFVTGLTLAPALWWGPGGSRLRGPVGRVVDPLSRRVGTWLVAALVVLGLAVAAGLYVEARGPSWAPAADHPFANR
ncbi:serine/threonine-protein kinase [Nocardioides dongxiaopingii]|uniref:serine/threonine-protein kinase n=1 Tax=Nocardioides dongxiaopingii TaxID=2576036 RepID=UPI0010C767D0|nr:serine/threonine-protein kinase [Nocardioides dongxiaopingii]